MLYHAVGKITRRLKGLGWKGIWGVAQFVRVEGFGLGRVEGFFRKRWLWKVFWGFKGVVEGRGGRRRAVGRGVRGREVERVRVLFGVLKSRARVGGNYRFLARRLQGLEKKVVREYRESLFESLSDRTALDRNRVVSDSLVNLENLLRKYKLQLKMQGFDRVFGVT